MSGIAIFLNSVLLEIAYVVLSSTNFALYDFFKIPKIVLSEDPLTLKCIQIEIPS